MVEREEKTDPVEVIRADLEQMERGGEQERGWRVIIIDSCLSAILTATLRERQTQPIKKRVAVDLAGAVCFISPAVQLHLHLILMFKV